MVFNPDTKSQVSFYAAELGDLTRIVLHSPPMNLENLYERVGIRSFDTFRLERWTLREPRGDPKIDNLPVLTNDETAIYIYAEPKGLASAMAESCSRNMVGR